MTNLGPLNGIKVIDLCSMISGPLATGILADQGAEVIKVEPPSGDQLRYMGPSHNGLAACFFACNRNKKSVRLDLKQDAAQEALRALIKDADVFVQNFRPGAIDRMGFGEAAVRKINPNIIYVSITGFGDKGPYADRRVYDPMIQALSGLTDIQADKATGRPKMVQFVVADKVTAVSVAQAISTALFYRERTGIAQHVRMSMLNAIIWFHWPEAMVGLTFEDEEFDLRQYQGTMDQVYKTKDGYITCSAVSNSEWAGICTALDKPEWIDDERFNTIAKRVKNAEDRKRMTAEEITKHHSAELIQKLADAQAPCAPLLTRPELLEHEQIAANQDIETHFFEGFGNVRQAASAAKFGTSPNVDIERAPLLGEHTESALRDAGLSDEAISTLTKQ